jgi:CHC2 zinc finger
MSFNRELLPDPESYFESHGHTLFGKSRTRFRTDCTIHGGANPNLSVLRDSGAFFCFSCGAKGGNVLDFEMQVTGCDFVTAAKALNAWTEDDVPSNYKAAPVSHRILLQVVAHEVNVAAMTVADVAAGRTISQSDKDRFLAAAGRINRVNDEVRRYG